MFKYLKRTKNYCTYFLQSANTPIKLYCHADWPGCTKNTYFRAALLCKVFEVPIHFTFKQKIIAQWCGKAVYMTMFYCKIALKLLKELF